MAEKPGSESAYPIIEQWVDELGEGRNRLHSPGLSIRQHAAIQLRVPEAEEEWLNDMIRRARRSDYVKAAMQGILGGGEPADEELLSSASIRVASACLKLESETREANNA